MTGKADYVVVRNLRLPAALVAAVDAEAGVDKARGQVIAHKLAAAYPDALPEGFQWSGRRACRWRGGK